MVKAQEYITNNYPDKTIKKLDISNQNLEGKLDLTDFVELEEFNCWGNKLSGLNLSNLSKLKVLSCGNNELEELNIKNCRNITYLGAPGNRKLNKVDLSDLTSELVTFISFAYDDLPRQDLSVFSRFTNLETISLGAGNNFYGSLKFLRNLNKLKSLHIEGSDIDSGLEYLPESVENLYTDSVSFPNPKNSNPRVTKIREQFASYNYDYQAWRNNNQELIKLANLVADASKGLTEEKDKFFLDYLINNEKHSVYKDNKEYCLEQLKEKVDKDKLKEICKQVQELDSQQQPSPIHTIPTEEAIKKLLDNLNSNTKAKIRDIIPKLEEQFKGKESLLNLDEYKKSLERAEIESKESDNIIYISLVRLAHEHENNIKKRGWSDWSGWSWLSKKISIPLKLMISPLSSIREYFFPSNSGEEPSNPPVEEPKKAMPRKKISALPTDLYEKIVDKEQIVESSQTNQLSQKYQGTLPNIGLPWQDNQPNQPTNLSITLPIRLINISDGVELVKRVESIMPSPAAANKIRNYATLSHSWGSKEGKNNEVDVTLAPASGDNTWYKLYDRYRGRINENKENIDSKNGTLYPRSYKSLLKSARALEAINLDIINNEEKINYLWMDQLCIDQRIGDNVNNVELDREMLKFRRYYANSTLTLVSIQTRLEDALNSTVGNQRARGIISWLGNPTQPINTRDAFNNALDILSVIMRSEWRFSSWTYKEGWLSKQTIFMFDDVLVDGRFLAMVWAELVGKRVNEIIPSNTNPQLSNFNEFRQRYRGKYATPIGWAYEEEKQRGENLITIRLNVALAALIGRRRHETLDSLRAILAVLPYGHLVEIEKWRGWANDNSISNNEVFQRALCDVMKVGAMNGYGEFLTWFGLGEPNNSWLPVIRDGRIFATNMVPRHRDVYCAPGSNDGSVNLAETAIEFTERIGQPPIFGSSDEYADFRKKFRETAAKIGGSVHTTLSEDTTVNNFIINQYNRIINIDPDEAVKAYNNGWIYGFEISDTGNNRKVTRDGGNAWTPFDWSNNANARGTVIVTGFNVGGHALTADDVAKINAYQLDANGSRWIPTLNESEKDRIRSAVSPDNVKEIQESIRNTRSYSLETLVKLKGFKEYSITNIGDFYPYGPGQMPSINFYRLDDKNIVRSDVFSRRNNVMVDGHEIVLEGTSEVLGDSSKKGEITKKNTGSLKLLVPHSNLWKSVEFNDDGTEGKEAPIALLVEKTGERNLGNNRRIIEGKRIDLVKLLDKKGKQPNTSLNQGPVTDYTVQIEVWPNK